MRETGERVGGEHRYRLEMLRISCAGSVEELSAIADAGADGVGFVCAVDSGPGILPLNAIADLVAQAPPKIETYLLTGLTRPSEVVSLLKAAGCKAIQFVRPVSPIVYSEVRDAAPEVRINQTVHVGDNTAVLTAISAAKAGVDSITLDTRTKDAYGAVLYGGTGLTHDWMVSSQIVRALGIPVILAGGLNPDNVDIAIRRVRPWGIDVCSGVRDQSGHLDTGKLSRLVHAVRPFRRL